MEEDSKRSRFNAGVALAERIDDAQKKLNLAKYNPLLINMETQTYNYEIMLSSNDILLSEAWAKLTDKEMKRGEDMRNLAHGFKVTFPIMNQNSDGTRIPIVKNYERFMDILWQYEKMNKEFLDSHSLNAPNMDDDDEGL